ncbi:MAG: hypothetical protein JRE40_00190 [Deltaproteobacteria bacterium]|nr:hypothetical protein [Deltaproteobacteria bacterium]
MKIRRTVPVIPDPPPPIREFVLSEREAYAFRIFIGQTSVKTRREATQPYCEIGCLRDFDDEDDKILVKMFTLIVDEFRENPYRGEDSVWG